MKRVALSIAVFVASAAAVLSSFTPISKAENIVFVASLLPSSEVPPIINADQFARGSVTITMDLIRDSANNITGARARFDTLMSGFPPGEIVILAHIHEGGATANGPIRVDTGISSDVPVSLPDGFGAFTRGDIVVPPALAAQIVNNSSAFYFNVHTVINPGGAMRGQLVRQNAVATPAPTLSQWGSLLMFLMLIAAAVSFLSGRVGTEGGALAGAGATAWFPVFDRRLLLRVFVGSEAAILLLIVLVMRSGAALSDFAGGLACGAVFAFIIHLLILNARRQ